MSNKKQIVVPDVRIHDQNSIWMFWPISDAAKGWVDKNIQIPSHMIMGPHFAVEHRYVDDLVKGMQEAGLTVESY